MNNGANLIEEAKERWFLTALTSSDWRLIREKRLLYEELSGNKTEHDGVNVNMTSFGDLPSTIQPADAG